MRRSEKEITDRAEIDAIIRRSQVCRIGLSDQGQAYIVPVCFGYEGRALYFHCAREGRKMAILQANNKVCFEFDIVEGIVAADQACRWNMRYQSVIGFGIASIVTDRSEKLKALALLMAQYSDRSFSFPEKMVDRTGIVKIEIETMTGKQSERLP